MMSDTGPPRGSLDLAALRRSVEGRVVAPGDHGWDDRAPALARERRPAPGGRRGGRGRRRRGRGGRGRGRGRPRRLRPEGLAPWATGRRLLNFVERRDQAASAFAPATLDRLRQVKRRYDPEGRIHSSHPVPGA
jgi:hypothetical protein